jgi:hypothetical protein
VQCGEWEQPLISVILIRAVFIATLTSGSALLANRVSPQRTARGLAIRVSFWLALVLFAVVIAALTVFLGRPCSAEDRVCDVGAMASAGVVMLGAAAIALDVIVGIPAAILTLRLLRRK